jgi:hypothetical protein
MLIINEFFGRLDGGEYQILNNMISYNLIIEIEFILAYLIVYQNPIY